MEPSTRQPSRTTDRRRHARVAFSPLLRPHLVLPTGRHDVLDASLCGLKILHTSPVRPVVGTLISGTLEWIHGEPPLSITGTIIRVSRNDFVIGCDPGTIPLGYIPWALPS